MIADLVAIIAPVLLCALLGYGWAKLGKPFDMDFVTSLVMYVGTPCLIISTFLQSPPDPSDFAEMTLASLAVFLLCGGLAWGFLLLCRLPPRDFLPVLTFPNAGNMGLPLCLFAFGDGGLALGIVFFTVASVLQFTLGASIVSGRWALGQILKTPLIYAVALALVFVLTGVAPPRWFANTVGLVGGLTIPLMILALGVSLARLRVASLGRSLLLSGFRLGIGFLLGLAVAEALQLEGTLRGVLILQSSLSPAVYNYLFAERFGRAGSEVAGVIVISTCLAFALLPFILAYLL